MRGFNKVIVAGNLARDPEVRYTASKKAYARFSVAVNYHYRDANGEYKEGVDYIPVAVWGNQAENCGKYLKKGSGILLEGRVQARSYDGRDGSKKYVTEIVADNVQFLGSGQSQSRPGGGGWDSGSRFNSTSMGPDYIPTDDDFGEPIGEHGFNDNFQPDDDDRSSGPESQDDQDIPF